MKLVHQAVADLNNQAILKGTAYALKSIPAPRYWKPNEPVALIVDVKPTPRHGEDGRLHPDGLLACKIVALSDATIENHFEDIRGKIHALKPGAQGETIGFHTWTQQPWHPFLLEWEVEVFPLMNKSNLHPEGQAYSEDFITSNYQLAENAVDLLLRPGQGATVKAANIYSGRSILTPHAKIQLLNQIEAFIEKRKAENKEIPKNILDAQEHITNANFHALAQSLGGFNEALLMHKQTLQLPITDPLGFEDDQSFTEDVCKAVERSNRSAPQPLNDFNPIRSGVFEILALRLVDTFGRVQTLKPDNGQVITTEVMTTPEKPGRVMLPPRLVQPARLNFRWLSANHRGMHVKDEPEMNAHPATTPICGWLLPNNLGS